MPLVIDTLINGIKELTEPDKMPANVPEMAEKWGTIIGDYGSQVIPTCLPANSEPAMATLIATLQGVTNSPSTFIPLMTAGLTAYAVSLVPGMLPGFVGVPPPVPIVLAAVVPAGLAGATGEQQAILLSGLIDAWFRTGTATPSSGGSPVPWS